MKVIDLTKANDNKYRPPAALMALESIINFWDAYQAIEHWLVDEEKAKVRQSVATISNILHSAVGEEIDFNLTEWIGRK